MIVVADSSPLIALTEIGQIGLLAQLYQQIWIPTAVWKEVVSRGRDPVVVGAIQSATWIHVVAVDNREMVERLRKHVDEGESEAIALALKLRANLLIIDDARGRRTAAATGIPIIGVIGTLVLAKRQGAIEHVGPFLTRLYDVGFRMSEELALAALKLANEG